MGESRFLREALRYDRAEVARLRRRSNELAHEAKALLEYVQGSWYARNIAVPSSLQERLEAILRYWEGELCDGRSQP